MYYIIDTGIEPHDDPIIVDMVSDIDTAREFVAQYAPDRMMIVEPVE